MMIEKIWRAFKAQLNKLANIFHGSDPIAQMQYEYDMAVVQLLEGPRDSNNIAPWSNA